MKSVICSDSAEISLKLIEYNRKNLELCKLQILAGFSAPNNNKLKPLIWM